MITGHPTLLNFKAFEMRFWKRALSWTGKPKTVGKCPHLKYALRARLSILTSDLLDCRNFLQKWHQSVLALSIRLKPYLGTLPMSQSSNLEKVSQDERWRRTGTGCELDVLGRLKLG